MYTNIQYFYTTYATVACLIHMIFPNIYDITYICLITFLIGSYLSFIHPRKYHFVFNYKTYIIKGWKRFLTVDILHILIFIYGFFSFHKMYKFDTKFMISFILSMIYFFIISIQNVYAITDIFTIIGMFIIISILYVLLRKAF